MDEKKGKLTVTITEDGKEMWKQDGISGVVLHGVTGDDRGVVGIYGELSILDMTATFIALSQSDEKMKVAFKLANQLNECAGEMRMKDIIMQAITEADDDKDAVPQEGSVEGAE